MDRFRIVRRGSLYVSGFLLTSFYGPFCDEETVGVTPLRSCSFSVVASARSWSRLNDPWITPLSKP